MNMYPREMYEDFENKFLSPYAAKASKSKGRVFFEKPCDVRTVFQRDRDRIIHSKAFRRLKHKTQVFISPEGDHFRTRLTHTLEVSQIARTIARALRLNEDLTEAISLGHDLGHTPFGHSGERALDQIHPNGFKHNIQSLRVVEEIEQNKGLNLTWEVRDGIVNHSGEYSPGTLEGQIVRLADRIAYINHDIDDAIRARIISKDSLPTECVKVLGTEHNQRINVMVKDIIKQSFDKPFIKMSSEIYQAMNELRKFLFKNVYFSLIAKKEEKKAVHIIHELYNYYINNQNEIPIEFNKRNNSAVNNSELVVDYIAGMTDRFVISTYQKLFIPTSFQML